MAEAEAEARLVHHRRVRPHLGLDRLGPVGLQVCLEKLA